MEDAQLTSAFVGAAPNRLILQLPDRPALADAVTGEALRGGDQRIAFTFGTGRGRTTPAATPLDPGRNPTGPRVLSTDFRRVGDQGVFTIRFDQAIQRSELGRSDNYLLVAAGVDGVLGTPDDVARTLTETEVAEAEDGLAVTLIFDELALGDYAVVVDGTVDQEFAAADLLDPARFTLERLTNAGSEIVATPFVSLGGFNDRLVVSGFDPLPAGRYRVTWRTPANANGVAVDGDGNGTAGGDYVVEFDVAPPNVGPTPSLVEQVFDGNAVDLEVAHDEAEAERRLAAKTLASRAFALELLAEIDELVAALGADPVAAAAAVDARLKTLVADLFDRFGVAPNEYAVVWSFDARFLLTLPIDDADPPLLAPAIGFASETLRFDDRIEGAVLVDSSQLSRRLGRGFLGLALVPIDPPGGLLGGASLSNADGSPVAPNLTFRFDRTPTASTGASGILYFGNDGFAGSESFLDAAPASELVVAPAGVTGLDALGVFLDREVRSRIAEVLDLADPLVGSLLVAWFDPVDFVLEDAKGRGIGQVGRQTARTTNGSYYSGDGLTELVVVPQALADRYSLAVVGLGGPYRAGTSFQTSTAAESIALQGLLKRDASLVAVLDFRSDKTDPARPLPGRPAGPPGPLAAVLRATQDVADGDAGDGPAPPGPGGGLGGGPGDDGLDGAPGVDGGGSGTDGLGSLASTAGVGLGFAPLGGLGVVGSSLLDAVDTISLTSVLEVSMAESDFGDATRGVGRNGSLGSGEASTRWARDWAE
ncbi:MAG: hypothetical protein ACRDD1_00180, partial [Planctomycetia bacterium]